MRAAARNWRLLFVRVLISGVAVVVTVVLVPGLGFARWTAGLFWLTALSYSLLTALLKPVLEFLALRFLVATYGLVVVLINAGLLFILVRVLNDFIVYDRLWQLLLGGLVVGILGLLLETLAGATEPVLDTRARPGQ